MINWFDVFSSSLWIVGLALMLAVFSYLDYPGADGARRSRVSLGEAARTRWAGAGALLFLAGMGLTAGPLWERAVWALLSLVALHNLWTILRSTRGSRDESLGIAGRPTAVVQGRDSNSRRSRVRLVAEWLVRTELLWLALLAPFLLTPTPERLPVLLGIPVLWIARRVACGHFVPRTPLDWPLALLMLMLLVSIFVTPDLAFSLDKITNLLLGLAVYYALVAWSATPGRVRWAVLLYSLIGAAVAVVGLLGTGWANKLPLLTSITSHLPSVLKGLSRAPEGFNPNVTAGALLWIVPLQLAMGWYSWNRGFLPHLSPKRRWLLRLALVGAVLVSGGTLLLTQSRGALLGFAMGGLLLLWLSSRRMRIAVVVVILAGLGLLAYMGPQQAIDKLLDAPGAQTAISSGIVSGQDRFEIWARAIYGIQDFPFTGMGLHAFRKVQPIFYPLFSAGPEVDIGHSHNQFLQVALDLGIPGLIAFLALWMLACALVVQCWRGAKEGWVRAASAGIGTSLLAYFVFAMTDVVVLGDKRGSIFWALLALLSALWKARFSTKAGANSYHVLAKGTQAIAEIGTTEAVDLERKPTTVT